MKIYLFTKLGIEEMEIAEEDFERYRDMENVFTHLEDCLLYAVNHLLKENL